MYALIAVSDDNDDNDDNDKIDMVRHRKYFSYIFGKTPQMKQYVECFER